MTRQHWPRLTRRGRAALTICLALLLAVVATSCTQRYFVCPDDAATGGYVPAMTPNHRQVVINLQETIVAAHPSGVLATAVGRAPWRGHYVAASYMLLTGIGWGGVAIINSGDDFVDPSGTIALTGLAMSALFFYLARQNNGAEERNYGTLPTTVGQCWADPTIRQHVRK